MVSTIFLAGCGGGPQDDAEAFATSGSREADQRAEQAVSKAQQVASDPEDGDLKTEPEAKTLFARLGGNEGLTLIVDDWTDRALADPRVNLAREDMEGGWISSAPEPWEATPENVAKMKKHIVQFLALAAGGPATYDGRPIKESHAGMQITNVQFDAYVGDLQATLDKLEIDDQEQKELLAVIETTREQIVEVR